MVAPEPRRGHVMIENNARKFLTEIAFATRHE